MAPTPLSLEIPAPSTPRSLASCSCNILDRYTRCKKLRDTLYGEIALYQDLKLDKVVVLKRVSMSLLQEDEQGMHIVKENPFNERDVMQLLEDPLHAYAPGREYVVQYEREGFFTVGDDVFIAMEFCSGGDLYDYVTSKPGRRLHETDALSLFAQIAKGVSFLHALGIAHRDLSLENVLVQDGTVKICDFGLSAETSHVSDDVVGKFYYMAPEVTQGALYDPKSADVWSLGILLFIMLTGSPLFVDETTRTPTLRVLHKHGVSKLLELWGFQHQLAKSTVKLLSSMLHVQPSRRLTSKDSCYSNHKALPATSAASMASSSRRSLEAAHAPQRPHAPRTSSTHGARANDTLHAFDPARDALESRLERRDRTAARRHFALYGRQHRHVDHLARPHAASLSSSTIVLQNTLLLQDNGRLTARLDQVLYVLDGLLGPISTPRAHVQSLLDLIALLQNAQVVEAIDVSRERHDIVTKVHQVVRTLAPTRSLHAVLALLVYCLSSSAIADGVFQDGSMLNVIMHVFKDHVAREGGKDERGQDAPRTVRVATPRRPKCLKRKHETIETRTQGKMDLRERDGVDKTLQREVDELLATYDDEFQVDDKRDVSILCLLCATLANLLHVRDASTSASPLHAPSTVLADTMFHDIHARKAHLVQNGGLDVLATSLVEHVRRLDDVTFSTMTLPSSRVLAHVSHLLSVLDHVTFAHVYVQRYLSTKRELFTVLLVLVARLRDACWPTHGARDATPTRTRALAVFCSALRVLINLTHRNLEAAGHVGERGGMHVIGASFTRVWTWLAPSSVANTHEEEACLFLLSLMVNAMELRPLNRAALSHVPGLCDHLVASFLVHCESYQEWMEGTDDDVPCDEQDAAWHPHHVLLGGATALVLGYLMQASSATRERILASLPHASPRWLQRSLAAFVALHAQVGALTPDMVDAVLHVEQTWRHDPETARSYAPASTNAPVAPQDRATHDARRRLRAFHNVCSRLDDSDDDTQERAPVTWRGNEQREAACDQVRTVDKPMEVVGTPRRAFKGGTEVVLVTPTRPPCRSPRFASPGGTLTPTNKTTPRTSSTRLQLTATGHRRKPKAAARPCVSSRATAMFEFPAGP
ncbi:hypothetical protein PsorP6_006394 [Peronosclerospora sorghi]|uniref:Uncharacterized protein n=1 Tax=Peronosclerospora sorghi TaxID=230839 RepID=A0ACC0W2P4_9STRA|nr:hypothetical protein PsorP6_006394 [Peronosclerospora sorghi]